jgi:hypothetical protein
MSRTRVILLAGAALAGVAATCVAHPGHPAIPTPTIAISDHQQPIAFELFRGNRIIIPVRINGHETKVLLDTGASLTTLDRGYARSIGLPEGFRIAAKGAGGDTDAELISGLTIDAGAMRITDANVAAMDLGSIERSIGMPIHAIFGRDVFNAGVISIDWTKHQLWIRSHEAFRPAAGAVALTLTKRGPFNTIPISIAGAQPVEALLDLGNGGALALPRTYWGDHPELTRLLSARTISGGVGGMHPAHAATIPQVSLAGVTLHAVPAVLSDSGNNDDPTQMANVGIGLLKQFRVDLDLGRDRIYLSPRGDRPAFDRDRAGVFLELLGNRLKAKFVSPDGPAAAAGLKQADEIVAVDGVPVTAEFYWHADWTRGAAGTSVELERADGSRIKVKLADYY